MSQGITIKLTGDAIAKILEGDDGQVKVELAQCIVEEFARKHLKALVNTDVMSKVTAEIRSYTAQYIKDTFGTYNSRSPVQGLPDHATQAVRSQVTAKFDELVAQFLEARKEYWEKYTVTQINTAVEKRITEAAQKRFDVLFADENIQRVLNEKVDDRIKEKLADLLGTVK